MNSTFARKKKGVKWIVQYKNDGKMMGGGRIVHLPDEKKSGVNDNKWHTPNSANHVSKKNPFLKFMNFFFYPFFFKLIFFSNWFSFF